MKEVTVVTCNQLCRFRCLEEPAVDDVSGLNLIVTEDQGTIHMFAHHQWIMVTVKDIPDATEDTPA